MLESIPCSGIVPSSGKCKFNFIGNWFSEAVLNYFAFSQAMNENSKCFTCLPTLGIVSLYIFSSWYLVSVFYSHFNLIVPDN